MSTVITHIPNNMKITAIKAIRSVTGWGLREAKEFVDTAIDSGGGVLSITLSEAQKMVLRNSGMSIISTDIPEIVDVVGVMRRLIMILLDKQEFKAAQYIIDALEEISNEDFR